MRNILLVSILALAINFSAGCKSKDQSAANTNNSNTSTASSSPTNPTAQPGSAVPQLGTNQPGAGSQNDPTSTGVSIVDSSGSSISMTAMDFHSFLLTGDKAKLEPLLASDYQRTRIDGKVVNKTQELASLKKVDDLFSMESQPAQINGDTATVSGKITLTSRDMSGQKKGTWQTIDTLKKRNDKWVIVSSVEKKN